MLAILIIWDMFFFVKQVTKKKVKQKKKKKRNREKENKRMKPRLEGKKSN